MRGEIWGATLAVIFFNRLRVVIAAIPKFTTCSPELESRHLLGGSQICNYHNYQP